MNISPVENVWRHYWAGLMHSVGGQSLLSREPLDLDMLTEVTLPTEPIEEVVGAKGSKLDIYEPYGEEGTWRRKLAGSIRNMDMTLREVLEGLDEYFKSFKHLKRIDRHAWGYFSRVGLPVGAYHGTRVWSDELDNAPPIVDRNRLPSMFGVYNPVPRAIEEKMYDPNASESDTYQMPHVAYFFRERRHHTAVLAPADTVIYCVVEWYTKRHWITRGLGRLNLGTQWYMGVGPDGMCRALPYRWQHNYKVRNHHGDERTEAIPHFSVPPGLAKMLKTVADNQSLSQSDKCDRFCHMWFAMVRSLSMAALDGVQVNIRKNGITARVGIPLQRAGKFFADRELTINHNGQKRKIFHNVAAHERHMADGRIIQVGESFRGIRQFYWKGYDILITIPGVHHAAAESFTADWYNEEDPDFPNKPMADSTWLGQKVQQRVWRSGDVRFRKGQPTEQYNDNPFFTEKSRKRDQARIKFERRNPKDPDDFTAIKP